MTKSDLIKALAEKQNLEINAARGVINVILRTMSEALSRGKNVQLRGFGTFSVKEYDSYVGINPKSGEKVTVKPKKLPVFRVGKQLRKSVNENKSSG